MDVIPEVHRLESIGVDYTSSGAIHFSFASRNYLLMLLDFAGVEYTRPFNVVSIDYVR